MNQSNMRLGPGSTPDVVKMLLVFTAIAAIGVALLEAFSLSVLGWGSPYSLLALSADGIASGYLWQVLSYLFVYHGYGVGVSFSMLISLVFHLYMIWMLGSNLIERLGVKEFLKLYFGAGIIGGVLVAAAMLLTGNPSMISTPVSSILCLLTVWVLLNPDAEVLLFFIIPVQAKWLIAGIVGAILLVTLSQGATILLLSYLTAIGFAYIYACVSWGLSSSFAVLKPSEQWLARQGQVWRQGRQEKENKMRAVYSKAKVVDINTGEANLDEDELFMDVMLEKISRLGENSLSWREKRRMQKISQTKSHK
jgi:hypothetical protein